MKFTFAAALLVATIYAEEVVDPETDVPDAETEVLDAETEVLDADVETSELPDTDTEETIEDQIADELEEIPEPEE